MRPGELAPTMTRALRGRFEPTLRLDVYDHYQERIGRGLWRDAESLRKPVALRFEGFDNQDGSGRQAGLDQATDDGRGHVAAPDEGDAAGVHAASVASTQAEPEGHDVGARKPCKPGIAPPHTAGCAASTVQDCPRKTPAHEAWPAGP